MAARLNHTIVAARDRHESATFLVQLDNDVSLDFMDPFEQQPGEINTRDGGRGLHWQGLSGHQLEIITRPYGA